VSLEETPAVIGLPAASVIRVICARPLYGKAWNPIHASNFDVRDSHRAAHMPADGVGEWSPKNFRGETFDSAHEAALTDAGKGADYLRQVSLAPSRTVPPNNPIDLQLLKLIDFHLLRWSAQQRLFCVVGALTSMLKTSGSGCDACGATGNPP
jgi:hypothetical protein